MEELIGEFWHKLICRQAADEFSGAAVNLEQFQHQLSAYYRGMGGAAGKLVEAADLRGFNSHRRWVQRVAGSHQRYSVCWQDDRSLRLPPVLACLPTKEMNENLYFWLAALAAELPRISHWFGDNQRATQRLLTKRPGLVKRYQKLAATIVDQRPDVKTLPEKLQARELAIQQAILEPGSIERLPQGVGDPVPVALWIYPEPLRGLDLDTEDPLDLDQPNGSVEQSGELKTIRKAAERFDDTKQTDGLLVFKLESLFSWAEQADLDRSQEEELDQDLQSAADDLDIIRLSRQRRSGAGKVKFDLDLPASQNDDLPVGQGILLPEWDFRRARFKKDYCLLQPMLADDAPPVPLPDYLRADAQKLQRYFTLLRPQSQLQRRQPFGEEIDLDAWMSLKAQSQHPLEGENLYLANNRSFRDLSTLVLADLSMSTESGVTSELRVVDLIRDSLLLLAEALSVCGDPFSIYGFSSIKNKQVRYQLLKNFTEPYADQVRGRLMAIQPGFYTRMGAAIRQSTEILKFQSSAQRLLLILSDGKPNDIDRYEGRYGIEDTRQAILEAKGQGLRPFCITIDERGSDYLPYLFGDQGFALVSDIQRLPQLLPKLYLNLTNRG
ncbi:nitric oxide reductase activation protein NorD [Motiliproteus sp. MSK22-1]|uniref:nitric oxide reductase activation protein NorD n=1 Tax=Motiliproteus sp. MSK22-1 TaxID=1897630 RepID=UPI00097747F8|nr:hypothetical protein [Motiliproteus sp. MSK22-1]OMH29466.1 hypothetical protein BGP75_19665 [Motiliproteus sp. MSK22-1]